MKAPRIHSWSTPSALIAIPQPLAPGEALLDPPQQQARYVAPIFREHFALLAQAARECAGSPASYITAQLMPGCAPRIRVESADSTAPFTAALKDPGCSMLHCGVYVWLTVTHGSLNVTRPDARPSSCIHMLASSPDHVLARSRYGLAMLIIPAQQGDLWSRDAETVWATLTSNTF